MVTAALKSPTGIAYAERPPRAESGWHVWLGGLRAQWFPQDCAPDPVFTAQVRAAAQSAATRDPAGLREDVRGYGPACRDDTGDEALAMIFGATVAATEAVLGFAHHDVQIAAGRALFAGKLVEMHTGEGKTLAASLPAAAAALAGWPVHVITTNDYLAARDAETLAPIYARLGLSVGAIIEGMSPDERQRTYAHDIVYCSSKELGFDYLKDRLALGDISSAVQAKIRGLADGAPLSNRLLLRGLSFAIVDEADSVLIDEARTPLIISGAVEAAGDDGALFTTAIALARELKPDRDFRREDNGYGVVLTRQGSAALARACAELPGMWRGPRRREALVAKALLALHTYQLDHHYLVRDDAIMIIDENTGRVHPDRAWEHGLQQLIEAKEGVTITAPREVLARISYQRLFRRYERLGGMTGTGREAAHELRRVYGLDTVCVPTHKPVQRRRDGVTVLRDRAATLSWLTARVRELHSAGRPVLIGTRSVAASEVVSDALTSATIEHRVLNAKQDGEEASVIAGAGQAGAVTVATSMAGRGTDIVLGDGVAARGGLHVISFEHHDASRIDRQLWGRCARQGDPGSYELVVSAEDELAGPLVRALFALPGGLRLVAGALRFAQWRRQRAHARARRALESIDERMDDVLAFIGAPK